jgi:hypothetical protein
MGHEAMWTCVCDPCQYGVEESSERNRRGLVLRDWPHKPSRTDSYFPAIQLSDTSDVGVDNRLQRVSCSVSKDEFLHVSRLDLASVVEDFPSRTDEDLSEMQSCHVNLAVAQGDIDSVLAGCRTIRRISSESDGKLFSR